MKISLYIPSYNSSRTIKECLEGALRQTVKPDEIIVIDDGSTDDSADIIGRYPVRLVCNDRNRGLVYSRNKAFKLAGGEFVAALDADCVASPDWLGNLMSVFPEGDVAGAGGRAREKYASSLADKWRCLHMDQGWGNWRLDFPPFLYGSNTVFRKTAIEETGFYNEYLFNNYEDVDLSKRMYDRGLKLVYNPAATITHLRQDTLVSLFGNYRGWWEQYYQLSHLGQRSFASKKRRIISRIGMMNEHYNLFKQFFWQDTSGRRYGAAAVDTAFFVYFFWKDAQALAREAVTL
jgi:glycosyltransferase involved in cell wall biosynthesis